MIFVKFIWLSSIFFVGYISAKTFLREGRIVGGYETTIEKHPWQALVVVLNSNMCGGSVIGNRWVITAPQCIERATANSTFVRIGSSLKQNGGQLLRVIGINIHPDYTSVTLDYGVSLLQLQEKIVFTKYVQPIPLVVDNQRVNDGTKCVITGWGATHNSSESNEILQEATIRVVNRNLCNISYKGEITERMICAGFLETSHTCDGDTGGPLTYKDNGVSKLLGVTSFGFDCDNIFYPGVFARIAEPRIRSWIRERTGI